MDRKFIFSDINEKQMVVWDIFQGEWRLFAVFPDLQMSECDVFISAV